VRELELKSLEEGRTSSQWESHLYQCTFAEDFFLVRRFRVGLYTTTSVKCKVLVKSDVEKVRRA
jgi:hypothetical protein